jgi:hypothetical protein
MVGKATLTPVRAPVFKIEAVSGKARWFKFLVYAEYGVGKTFLMGTAANVPDMRDVLMISAESGDLTLDDPSRQHSFHLIDVVKVTNYSTVGRVFDFLKQHCFLRDQGDEEKLIELQKRFFADTVPDPERIRLYRTCLIDSLTETEQYCMYQLTGVSDATRMDEETQGAEWAEYKRQHGMIQRMVRQFRDLPMHVIMSCARTYVQNDVKKMIYQPAMTGKLASQVQGFMDMVGYLTVVPGATGDETKAPPRRLFVQPGSNYSAKCRFSAFKGNYFDNPTIEGILQKVGMLASTAPASAVAKK